MASERVYKKAFSQEKAIEMIRNEVFGWLFTEKENETV